MSAQAWQDGTALYDGAPHLDGKMCIDWSLLLQVLGTDWVAFCHHRRSVELLR